MMRYALEWTGGRFDPAGQEKYPLFPVEVPGNIQYDFAKFQGLIEGLQFSDQVKRLEETEDYYWEYRAVAAYDLRPASGFFWWRRGWITNLRFGWTARRFIPRRVCIPRWNWT